MLVTKLIKSSSLIVNKNVKLGCVFSSPEFIRTHLGNKHWNPKWRKFRALKTIKIDLPDYHKKESKEVFDMTKDEQRSWFKEIGIQPVRPWEDKPFTSNSTTGILDQYVPPEGDGKLSPLNTAGAKQRIEWLQKKGASWKALRDIRRYDEDFELYPDFIDAAQQVYVKAHEALAENDREKLIEFVTEKAYPIMLFNCTGKTIRWNLIKSLEPARVCHIRTMDLFNKYNKFAQITVRLHTQQTLVIYDRFGRLMHGSETVGKDVLEYVVFEKHLSNHYGKWRLHHKIIPDWIGTIEPSKRTYVLTDEAEQTQDEEELQRSNTLKKVPI